MSVEIIAEVAGGHLGEIGRALRLIAEAQSSGADAIKFQLYFADELCAPDHPDYDVFKSLEFSSEEWTTITASIKASGLKFYVDVFGTQFSLPLAKELDVDALQVHASDVGNLPLLRQMAALNKPLFLGIGGRKRVEVYEAVTFLQAGWPDINLTLLVGHQTFPTPLEEHSLEEIRWFISAYKDLGVKVGCSDHFDGADELAIFYPLAAVGAGAIFIEKHLTLDREEKCEDYESALNPSDFKKMAELIRCLNRSGTYPLWTEGRQKYRQMAVKSPVAKKDLQPGECLTDDVVEYIRCRPFAEPLPAAGWIGQSVHEPISASVPLSAEQFKQKIGILVNVRVASTRLPGKALKKICGVETIALLLERIIKGCRSTNEIILCITQDKDDDVLCEIAGRYGIKTFRGPTDDIARRLLLAADKFELDHIVRVTGDDLLRSTELIDEAVELHMKGNADYTYMQGVLYGGDSEIISRRALESIVMRAEVPENTEYLTWYLDDPSAFVQQKIEASEMYQRDYRLTLDTAEDFSLFRMVFEALYVPGESLALLDVVRWLDENPDVAALNREVTQKLDRNVMNTAVLI